MGGFADVSQHGGSPLHAGLFELELSAGRSHSRVSPEKIHWQSHVQGGTLCCASHTQSCSRPRPFSHTQRPKRPRSRCDRRGVRLHQRFVHGHGYHSEPAEVCRSQWNPPQSFAVPNQGMSRNYYMSIPGHGTTIDITTKGMPKQQSYGFRRGDILHPTGVVEEHSCPYSLS